MSKRVTVMLWNTTRAIRRRISSFGIRLVQSTPIDLRGTTAHPIAATYHAEGCPFLLEVPLGRCRGMEGLGFDLTLHPFVLTLKAYANGKCDTFEASPLAQYYDYFQPKTVADALGLGGDSALARFPAIAMVLPWEPLLPLDAEKRRRRIIRAENRQLGVNGSAYEFWNVIGPVSQEQGALELSRLIQLFEGIRICGYRRSDCRDGDVSGVILLNGEDWAVTICGGGQHRLAVLAGLGFTNSPIRIKPDQQNSFIRRYEADSWPNVQSGMFTREEAVSVFDRIFNGRPPHTAIPPLWHSVDYSRRQSA